jgi:hypothetical protein
MVRLTDTSEALYMPLQAVVAHDDYMHASFKFHDKS